MPAHHGIEEHLEALPQCQQFAAFSPARLRCLAGFRQVPLRLHEAVVPVALGVRVCQLQQNLGAKIGLGFQ